ncbi:recombinase family protein [Kosakonia radicincitans]|uniref:recombinase family protein n=1 Tax=Kosakonia radicincitans TaxID=283686 RepID=UPI001D09219B
MLIDENNSPKEILKFNKRKSIQTDRVRLIPGPKEEIKIVNLIYDLFIEHSMPELLISEKLNEDHIPAENGSLWTRAKVHQILINEKYIGNNVYNRTSGKLKSKTVKNPRSEWIILEKAFKPIVSRRKFFKAQDIIRNRSLHFSDDELLNYLKKKLTENGKLSGFIIDEDDTGPSSSVYRNRFGGLLRAYTLIGYKPEHDYSYIELNNYLREYHWQVLEKFKNDVISKNCLIDDIKYHPLIKINDEISISLILCRCNKLKSGKLRWKVRFDAKLNPDLTIVFRMNKDNSDPLDYYILPKLDVAFSNMIMTEKNNLLLELYRYESLETFLNMIQRIDIRGFYAA